MSDMLKRIALLRCNEICDELAEQEWYRYIRKEALKVREPIVEAGMGDLMDKYDDLCMKISCRTEEEIYIQGIKDGMKIDTYKALKIE